MEARIIFIRLQLRPHLIADLTNITLSYVVESCAKCIPEWEGKDRNDTYDFRNNDPMLYCWFCRLYYHQFCFEDHRLIVLPLHKLRLPAALTRNFAFFLVSCNNSDEVFCSDCELTKIPCKCNEKNPGWYFHGVEDRLRPSLIVGTSFGRTEMEMIRRYAGPEDIDSPARAKD